MLKVQAHSYILVRMSICLPNLFIKLTLVMKNKILSKKNYWQYNFYITNRKKPILFAYTRLKYAFVYKIEK